MPLARLHSNAFHGVATADGMTAFAVPLGSNAIVAELAPPIRLFPPSYIGLAEPSARLLREVTA